MKYFNKLIVVAFFFSIIIFVACSSKKLDKEVFISNVQSIFDLVKDNNDNIKNAYIINTINDNILIMNNYNDKIDISQYNVSDGYIIKNSSGQYYLLLENEKYCAVKDFNDSEIIIYDISERDKCHKPLVTSDVIYLSIFGINASTAKSYEFSSISDDDVILFAINNIYDDSNCIYKWYRNGELLTFNGKTLILKTTYEDANYVVEIITPDGMMARANTVNVKIQKNI